MVSLVRVGGMMGAGRSGASGPPTTAFTLVTDATNTTGLTGGSNSSYVRNGVRYKGFVSVVDGKQYVLGFNIDTGAIVSKTEICSAYTAYKDDHNPAIPWLMPDGTTVMTLVSAHNVEAVMKMRRSTTGDLADLGVESSFSTVAAVTYPTPLEHPGNGEAIFAYRGAQNDWYLTRSSNNGASWSNYTNPIWHHTSQTYCRFFKIADNEYLCHAAANPVAGDPQIWCFRVNTSTGAIRNAAGTTIANFKTGSPAASANTSNADLFYTAPTGTSCTVGEMCSDGTVRYFNQGTVDGQFDEFWVSRCTTANTYNPADWVHEKICDAGYGVGSTTASPWTSTPNIKEVFYPGIIRKRLAISQLLRGTNYGIIVEQQADNTWKNVLAFNEQAVLTDHSEFINSNLSDSTSKVICTINPQDHADYNAITNATLEVLVVSSLSATAPVITASSSYSVNEYCDWIQEITADQPCGINIVGGADADKFEIIGGKYLKLIRAADYDAPHDANADNQFVVQVAARGFGADLESAAFTITLSINSLVKSGGSQLFTQTADLTNAAWTASGLGTRVNNSTDVLDPDGGNTMDKLPQSATTTSHNVSQSRTVTANAEHTDHYEWHLDAEAPFAALRRVFGATNVVAKFDLRRGQYVNGGIGGVLPTATFCIPLANNCFRIGMTYIAPSTTASGQGGPAVCQFAGPSTTELGITAAAGYVRNPNHMTGKYKTHVARTT